MNNLNEGRDMTSLYGNEDQAMNDRDDFTVSYTAIVGIFVSAVFIITVLVGSNHFVNYMFEVIV